ncbi:hypothetical protein AVEN_75849-1 [Araneus ventricosus]|uniref:Uncharacterized protein n=1 Tax=Araneus ventricosus TaxID=182803 RepID=A0A4Y2JJF5_ARAVE|nr:hypothetical protein AVEN_75849-1 [Araneus ventricosus]
MTYLTKGRNEDMFVLAKKLDLETNESMTIKRLKDLILGDTNYDDEFSKNIFLGIIEQRQADLEEKQRLEALAETQRQTELEEKKRQEALAVLKRKDEVELERLRIEAQLKLCTIASEQDYSNIPTKEVSKFIHKFEAKIDISLYLVLLERQVHRLAIAKEHWVSYLLGLLPPEISHIITREPDEKANDYDHIKELLIQEIQVNARKVSSVILNSPKGL